MIARLLLLGVLVTLAVIPVISPVQAQTGNGFVVSGTVEMINTTSIAVMNDENRTVETFMLAPDMLVLQNKTATLTDIKPDDFVASAAVKGVDGKLHSTELRIFPAAMRGVGEGQRPMNDARDQTMTNATVTGTAIVNGSNSIKVKFKGGESELMLDPGVPITRIDVADEGLLKSGAKVRVQGVRGPAGVSVTRIIVQ